ncbi:MAG: IclR family transcriptional regulator [Chloroflexi bacterium]|nr:MAG: IclR family transcriptional regulator [Chloroflexota bacterium]
MVLLDEIGLEQERLGNAPRQDVLETFSALHHADETNIQARAEVVADSVAQDVGLADIQDPALSVLEQVDARLRGEGGDLRLEGLPPRCPVHAPEYPAPPRLCFRRADGGFRRVKESTAETPKRARRSVQSVDRALDLLEALAGADGEVAITALATRTGLHVSTVHRLLATLLRRGYVRQNPDTSRYYAGAKLAMLTEGRSRYGELRLRARPLLRSLTDATRETANLVVLDDVQAVYIDTVPSPQVVRLFTAIGNRTPLHATGAGKALLAALPSPRRDALLDRIELRGYTARTIVDRASLRRMLDEIRERGYAIDDEEYDDGVRCVAVAVAGIGTGRDAQHGGPIAALSISAPANRLSRQRCAELAPLLRRTAAELAEAIRDQAGGSS